jgi:hypothetical protein
MASRPLDPVPSSNHQGGSSGSSSDAGGEKAGEWGWG